MMSVKVTESILLCIGGFKEPKLDLNNQYSVQQLGVLFYMFWDFNPYW